MGDEAVISTVQDVLATEPVIRRVVAARVANPADVDDLVHDCLERLLAARHRLAPETVLPFSVVTARNLVFSQARMTARRAAPRKRPLDPAEADRPEDRVLAGEARAAMRAALAQLSERDRADLLAAHEIGPNVAGAHTQASSGAMRVRMARARAKLRLEYLLAFRRVSLPTPTCRSVLLAISGGDARRQRALHAGDHLLTCDTCAELHEPLAKRNLALTAVVSPVAVAAWVAAKARAHPLSSATGSVAAAAVVGAVLVQPASGTPHVAERAVTSTTAAPAAPRPTWLSVGGRGLPSAALRGHVGQPVAATAARVEEVVSHNGFWVGTSPTDRVWVELVGPLRPIHIVGGDRLRFDGTIVANPPSFPARAGLDRASGAVQLSAQGAHIDIATTAVHITSP